MKAFIWAVVACIVIAVGAGTILVSQQESYQSARIAEGVRVK